MCSSFYISTQPNSTHPSVFLYLLQLPIALSSLFSLYICVTSPRVFLGFVPYFWVSYICVPYLCVTTIHLYVIFSVLVITLCSSVWLFLYLYPNQPIPLRLPLSTTAIYLSLLSFSLDVCVTSPRVFLCRLLLSVSFHTSACLSQQSIST